MSSSVSRLSCQPLDFSTSAAAAKRILLIDRAEDSRTIIRFSLEMIADWQVLTAASIGDGVILAVEHLPDLILLDTETAGSVLTEHLCLYSELQHVPIVLIVPRIRLGDRLSSEQQGIAAIISKPFDPVALVQCLVDLFAPKPVATALG